MVWTLRKPVDDDFEEHRSGQWWFFCGRQEFGCMVHV